MDLVTLVLASPRGRFFCANVAYMCNTDERAARPRTPADVLERIEAVDVQAISGLSELDLLNALAIATNWARYWQPPDEDDLMFATPEIVAALHPVAATVLESPLTRWWAEPVDLDNQRMIGQLPPDEEWPESTLPYRSTAVGLDQWRDHVLTMEARFRTSRAERPDNAISGEWWSTPLPSAALETSRALDDVGALELLLEEDSFGGDEARVWPVTVRRTPRVYEITNPTDWARLVDAYPLAVVESKRSDWFHTTGEYHDWFIPDWTAVADDYDAVHLTLHGYLTTPGLAIPLADNNGATVLAGWNPDATWWLNNDVAHVDDEPALWRWCDDHWVRA
ncbi:hypothetical protein [Rhodococcus opacus]|uniref:hypothetical protein n=1 Tax=Rhodococcus opacus TaxID=37919 RepID=UPI000EAA8CBE|nr:hypothetical protein [Rhodococcus opacus]QZS56051.1 hypothetical protein FXW36_39350 [Rhodococcus opacus]RKM70876.1 hypothetical protein COO55_01570 [Rhodococcus opacus]